MLLTAIPFTPITNNQIHPLTLPLTFASKHLEQKPRILFINLDGRETIYNLRALRLLPEEYMYISIFKEPDGSDLLNIKLDNNCE